MSCSTLPVLDCKLNISLRSCTGNAAVRWVCYGDPEPGDGRWPVISTQSPSTPKNRNIMSNPPFNWTRYPYRTRRRVISLQKSTQTRELTKIPWEFLDCFTINPFCSPFPSILLETVSRRVVTPLPRINPILQERLWDGMSLYLRRSR